MGDSSRTMKKAMAAASPATTTEEDAGGGGGGGGGASNDRFAKLRAMAKEKAGGGAASSSNTFKEELGLSPLVESDTIQESDQRSSVRGVPKSNANNAEDEEMDLDKMADEFAGGVQHYSMEEYVQEHFNLKRKGFFGSATTVEKILNWKDELIKKPLHPMADGSMASESVQAFKNVVSYMGERKSSKDDIGHATKLLG